MYVNCASFFTVRTFSSSVLLCNSGGSSDTTEKATAASPSSSSDAGGVPTDASRNSLSADAVKAARSSGGGGADTPTASPAADSKGATDAATKTPTQEKKPKEETPKEKKPPPVVDSDTTSAEAKLKDERFLDAETTLRVEEVFSQDTYQRFIHTTEVSTVEGLRWLDVSASSAFFADPLMARVPEGQFAYSVMRKLFGSRFPIGVYASVASGAAMPATYVDENWACLILRSTKERPEGGGSASRRASASHGSPGRATWQHTPADYDVDRAAVNMGEGGSSGSTGEYVYDESTSNFYPRQLRASQRWLHQLKRRWGRTAAGTPSGTSTANPSNASVAEATASMRRRRHRRGSSSSSYRSPLTMADFTDRLTIFLGKELHPVENDPDAPAAAAPAPGAGETPVLSLNVDRTYASHRPAAAAAAATPQPAGAGAAKPTHYEVRWRVITVHRSPITFIKDMQGQWNKLTSRGGRAMRTMRTVPAHSSTAVNGEEAIKHALRRAARPADMTGEDDDADGYGDAANTVIDRVEGWEDLVRLLYHGAARTLQESAYCNTRRLEVMETEIFDASDSSAQHLHSMTRLMAELHLLSREATLHNAILRESKVAYQKLKRVLDHPLDLADQRELLYVDSVLSISAHLEEQSESLLFLQFSVAMNQTEQHLRTLTIFNTIFVPLDLICTCCGSEIFTSGAMSKSKEAMYAVFGLMGATTVVTIRWIKRNLR